MNARYLAVDGATLDELLAAPATDRVELVNALEDGEEQLAEVFDLDKLWDGLHYLLTGVSAAAPVDGDRLSEAVVGVHVLDAGDEFLAATDADELPGIVAALEAYPIDEKLVATDFANYDRARLYPDIWRVSDAEATALRKEIAEAYAELLAFLRRCRERDLHVVVTIW